MENDNRQLVTIRVRPVDEPIFARLKRASGVIGWTEAQIMRDAIREKLDRLAVQFPQIDTVPEQQPATTN